MEKSIHFFNEKSLQKVKTESGYNKTKKRSIYFPRVYIFLGVISLMAFTGKSTENEDTIRVMTFNIAAGSGDIDEIARVIQIHKPDIVGLQEVDVHWSERSNFIDQAGYLGESLDMHPFLGEIYSFESDNPNAPPRQFGLLILSKEPFIVQKNHHLTRLSTQASEPELKNLPGFPEIAVERDGIRFHVFNTHLDYRPDPAVRKMEVEEMMAVLGSVEGPIILMGDLNAQPDAEELQPLFNILQDVWHGNDQPGYTYPAEEPERRIDYILYSDHFRVKKVYVADTGASDHRPVVADFILTADHR